MKRALLRSIFSVLAPFLFTGVQAQKDQFAYAVTDLNKDGSAWNVVRKINLQTGVCSDVLFNGLNAQVAAFDAATKKALSPDAVLKAGAPFASGVAAMAYDRRHQRLYFTPMLGAQLRYVDLRTMKVFYVEGQLLQQPDPKKIDEGKVITRMAIAPNGDGYAVSNDGGTFIRFSTGKKPRVEQLGALIDDPANNGISIHNRCSSYGGDMVADDEGNFLIVTARNTVFKLYTQTRVAKYLGAIEGLPKTFTVNGAVVDGDGSLLVSSAVDGSAYYTVDVKTFKATPFAAPAVFRSSDLANSNYLAVKPQGTTLATIPLPASRLSGALQIYPNPVRSRQITLQFDGLSAGNYQVEVVDVLGRRLLQRRVQVAGGQQAETLSLPRSQASGVYLVRVTNRNSKTAFEQKLVVQ